jgi:hypothetical protein
VAYRNAKDAERRRAYARNYAKQLYDKGKQWQQQPENKAYVAQKRRRRTLRQYNLTPERWNALFESQNKACAICRSLTPNGLNWATDHDHNTNEVRGILCSGCNTGIGQFRDSSELLESAARYLQKVSDGKP